MAASKNICPGCRRKKSPKTHRAPEAAKTAEKVLAVLQFFFMGVAAGAIFFAIMRLRDARPDLQSGLVLGVIVGLPMVTISIAIGGSDREPVISILWLLALFLAWGVALKEA